MKQRVIHDDGVTKPGNLEKFKLDNVPEYSRTPRSPYAITETVTVSITNKIVEKSAPRLNIADGAKRPGTR